MQKDIQLVRVVNVIKIKILCIGNLKENYLLAMQNEYLKRLTNYAKVEIKEEKEEKK